MAADPIVGVEGPRYQVRIEWGAIRQFVRSLCSSHPAWMEDPLAVVPPTFLMTAGYHWGYILERPPAGTPLAAIGADRGPMMDGEQAFVFHGPPPRAGDVLTASTRVAEHFFKEGRSGGRLEFFRMQTDFHDAGGRLVAQWLPTSIRTERAAAQSFEPTATELPFLRRGEKRLQMDQARPPVGTALGGWAPGPVVLPPLTLTDIVRFQCASGEDSPGHHDLGAARANGFPGLYSIGMLHASLLGAYAAAWLGPANVRSFRARFLDMVWQGDALSYDGRVTGHGRSEEGATVDVELECLRSGQPVVKAWATFLNEGGT